MGEPNINEPVKPDEMSMDDYLVYLLSQLPESKIDEILKWMIQTFPEGTS